MIGIFDSGLGGLTALKELAKRLPNEDLVYFGDTGRVPYGTRSVETIKKYSLEDLKFLSSFGVDAVLVACGTVSSTALTELRAASDKKIYGVITPAVEAAIKATENGRIGVIGTNATIKSGAFVNGILKREPSMFVKAIPCPLFVPLVENGFAAPDDDVTLAAVKRYLAPFSEDKIDTLILGCTHYPIISWAISRVLPGVKLISSGAAAADAVADDVISGRIKTSGGSGSIRCYCSDMPSDFEATAEIFMGDVCIGRAEKINIEDYSA